MPPLRTLRRRTTTRHPLFLQQLEHPRQVVSNLTPNWYASVTGTGIVAVAASDLPVAAPMIRTLAVSAWLVAAALLIGLTTATAVHWVLHRDVARRHHLDPVIGHFYGAPPMALLTVGAGALLVGRDVLGLELAVGIDWTLWIAGTILGLANAALLPVVAFTRHVEGPHAAFGGWLMPVIPPMVSASTGALLLPFVPSGDLRETMFWSCFALAGASALCSVVVLAQIWGRLAQHQLGPAAMVPTLWIVLAPAGQSIAATNLLADNASQGAGLSVAALITAAEIWGFGVLGFLLSWTAIASAITVRALHRRLPFGLSWWSFTFPIGATVVGLNALVLHVDLLAVRVLAVTYFVALLVAWATVAVGTFHGSWIKGVLFIPPTPVAPDSGTHAVGRTGARSGS